MKNAGIDKRWEIDKLREQCRYLEERREKENQSFLTTASVFFAITPLATTLGDVNIKEATLLLKLLPFPGIVVTISWFIMLYKTKIEMRIVSQMILDESKEIQKDILVTLQEKTLKALKLDLFPFQFISATTLQEMLLPVSLFLLNIIVFCVVSLK